MRQILTAAALIILAMTLICAPGVSPTPASSGCSLPPGTSAPKGRPVSAEEARRIALENVPGSQSGDIVKFDYDKAKRYFIVQINYMTKTYEVTVSEADGSVVYFDKST